MATIAVTNINDGDAVTAASVNNQINTIVNDYNGNITAANLASNAVTTAKITDANVTFAKLLATIFSGQIVVSTNAGAGGGDTNFLNLGGVKIAWGLTANSASVSTNGVQPLVVNYPTTFAAAPKVLALVAAVTGDNRLGVNVLTNTTTILTLQIASFNAGAATAAAYWLAIGT